jgi:hypothetical protein
MEKKQVVIDQHMNGRWVPLIIIPLEDGGASIDGRMKMAMDAERAAGLANKLYNAGKLCITENGYSIVITAANGPVRVQLQ